MENESPHSVPSAILQREPPLTIWWLSLQTFFYGRKLCTYVICMYIWTIPFFILSFTMSWTTFYASAYASLPSFWNVYGRSYYGLYMCLWFLWPLAAFIRPFPSCPGPRAAWGTESCPLTASSWWSLSLKDQQVKYTPL